MEPFNHRKARELRELQRQYMQVLIVEEFVLSQKQREKKLKGQNRKRSK
ncbi:hypothetical protein LAU_0448 [Lausannevirus]|uniref:Uncharacterized protein n=1 Tax=Lausannevirus TaxID=999883 RepID=F2WM25_9VIRU|nr:hypothetical protein LAU_0448 [Lausannevirus]AEA07298.1 hypothetical protein LAU_0448 [Lausannevirus]